MLEITFFLIVNNNKKITKFEALDQPDFANPIHFIQIPKIYLFLGKQVTLNIYRP